MSVFGGLDFPGDVPFTIEAWVDLDSGAAESIGQDVSSDTGANHNGFGLFVADPQLYGGVRTELWSSGTLLLVTQQHAPAPTGRFFHLAVSHDLRDGLDHLFVDGTEAVEEFRGAPGPRPATGSAFVWGGFVGALDELAVYDKALPVDRIAAHVAARAQ